MSAGSHLLVTTTRAAWLLDVQSGRASLVDDGRGVYYGISFSEDEVFIACRQAEVGADRTPQDNCILRFDRALRPRGVLRSPAPIRDVHQVCYHAGTLFVCSTYDDTIACYATRSQAWRLWRPFGPGGAQDEHHINSIHAGPEGFLLAGNRPFGWFARCDADGVLTGAGRLPLGVGTHNVWPQGGDVAICSSDEGVIRSQAGHVTPLVERGWVRGFAQDGVHRYVGVSQNRVRGIRERSDCMILRLRPDDTIDRTYAFQGFGMLHDIRMVGVGDTSHNRLVLGVPPMASVGRPTDYQTLDAPIHLDDRAD